jgi:hypothetical protein
MVARWAGRKGRRWREAKATLNATSQLCWWCGHQGAREADHEPARVVLLALGLDPNDPRYLRPIHGASCRCPTCGQACNQVKGKGERRPRMTSEW